MQVRVCSLTYASLLRTYRCATSRKDFKIVAASFAVVVALVACGSWRHGNCATGHQRKSACTDLLRTLNMTRAC
eukprot:10989496-Lingulodinium_polyedra.AAC.1